MRKSEEIELRKWCGDIDHLCGFKDYIFNDGRAKGVRATDVKNGKGLELTIVPDRGLDIPYLSYKGINIGLLNKPGLKSPFLYREEGAGGFLKQFFGGMLTTCGMSYAGAAGVDGGRALGLHGSFNNTPAEHVAVQSVYNQDERILTASGDIRQVEVFAENLVTHRKISVETESNQVHIHDEVENLAFEVSPLMMVYHMNFGYPMLDEGARVYSSCQTIRPRTEYAEQGMAKYNVMEVPMVGVEEQCYYHLDSKQNDAFAMLHNEKLGIAAIIHYDAAMCPILCEWKCMRAGDYALGLEPTTCGVLNRSEARENGTLKYIQPGEVQTFDITLEITEDTEIIKQYTV